ncbi:hypothetical protein [Cellulomonas citrea]|uniref:hypothetical protein n=1 Tax=Cellulomonas citrea TaxID=1909423 RepID=UPI00135A418C|nr:hypothetical protein [Cellulomonas citrea]
MQDSDGAEVRRRSLPIWWQATAVILGVVSGLLSIAALVWDFPLWLAVVALGGVVLGGLMSLPVVYVSYGNSGRSRAASVWRALTEPIRFMFRWMV